MRSKAALYGQTQKDNVGKASLMMAVGNCGVI